MLDRHKHIVFEEFLKKTGFAVDTKSYETSLRQALKIWLYDLGEKGGPIVEMKPYGFLSHRVTLSFGNYSQRIINQIGTASEDAKKLARTLVRCASEVSKLEIVGQSMDSWTVRDVTFKIVADYRHQDARAATEEAVLDTCRNVVIPLMAAMTELIGHDSVDSPLSAAEPEFEGERSLSVFEKRERSPRNRLACLSIHGHTCIVCGLTPKSVYGSVGEIIEVHHLEPLSLIEQPQLYDPETDLVPLCPNCHRAVHTKKPHPLTLEELRDCMEKAVG